MGPVYEDRDFADLFGRQGPQAVSPGMLAMVVVLQFAEGLTDRQAADAVRTRIDWKYVLRLELDYNGFDASDLSEFRGRLVQGDASERLLNRLLDVFRAKGAIKSHTQQRTDSTHVLDAVRTLSRLEMVGEAMRHALNVLAEVVPDWLREKTPRAWYERYGDRFDTHRLPKKPRERHELAMTIGQDGANVLNWLYADKALKCLWCAPAVNTLRRVWLQNFTQDDDGLHWREPGNVPPSAKTLASPYDTDTRYSNKRGMEWVGYKVHLTETCVDKTLHVITDVLTTPATTNDADVTSQIQERLIERKLKPDEHLADSGYSKSMVLVKSRQNGIDLIAPVKADGNIQAKNFPAYAMAEFTIDWEKRMATCPQGKHAQVWTPSSQSGATYIRFNPSDCAPCDARTMCIKSSAPARTLKLLPRAQFQALTQARLDQKTAAFKRRYARRAGAEAMISQGTRAFALRASRYIGLAKTHLQQVAVAAAINIKRFCDFIAAPPAARPVQPFCRLARLA